MTARRGSARYRVFLSVRYDTADEFVRDYAENLSRGGLFVRGARGLARRRDVSVELELPGYGTYRLQAEVVHVIGDGKAQEHDRQAGAGLAIREAPAGFEEALSGYLIRLSRRSESLILVGCNDECSRLLGAAGYQVEPFEQPDDIDRAIDRKDVSLIGVVAPEAQIHQLRRQVRDTAQNLLVTMDDSAQLESALVELDRRL